MFTLIGILMICAGGLLWMAYEAYRFMDVRKAALAAFGAALFLAFSLGGFVVLSRHPELESAKDRGHGAGWDCQNLGRGGADVCTRDKSLAP